MPFKYFFDSTLTINNRARGGRSTRTFISENRWQPVADSLQERDYVLMQFGHNDEASEEKYKDRYTPVQDYKTNLAEFITETRLKKAIPILITPVTCMRFDKEGKLEETHREYSAGVWEVAKQYDAPEHPNYPGGQKDNIHFNEYGARRMAELVRAEIRRLNLELVNRIVDAPVKK